MKINNLLFCISILITHIAFGMDDKNAQLTKSKDEQLYWAIKEKDNNLIRLMMNVDGDLASKSIQFKWQGDIVQATSPLEVAMTYLNLEVAKWFIENGAPVNKRFKDGYAPLTSVVRSEDHELIKLMIDHGADTELLYIYPDYSPERFPTLKPWRTVIWSLCLEWSSLWMYPSVNERYKQSILKGAKILAELGASILAPDWKGLSFIKFIESKFGMAYAIELATLAIRYAQEKDPKRLNDLLSHDSKAIRAAKEKLALD